jgi:hypothetical protein
MELRTARLSPVLAGRILALEAKLGARVVALEPVEDLADVSPADVRRISSLEEEIGVALVAYRVPPETAAPTRETVEWKMPTPAGLALISLNPEQVHLVQSVEDEAGLILLCYGRR